MFHVNHGYIVTPCLKTNNHQWSSEIYILLHCYIYLSYHCLNALFLIHPYYTFCGSANRVGYTFEIDTSKHLLHCYYLGPRFPAFLPGHLWSCLFSFLSLSSMCLKTTSKIISLKCNSNCVISPFTIYQLCPVLSELNNSIRESYRSCMIRLHLSFQTLPHTSPTFSSSATLISVFL